MRLILAFALSLLPLAGHAETMVIGTEALFPPIVHLDESGNLTGRDKDIGDEICRRAGWHCDWIVTEFDALLPGILSGQFDFVIAGLSASPDREETVDFTDPYRPVQTNLSLFVGLASGIDPATARIAVQGNTSQSAWLDVLGYQSVLYPDNVAAFDAMIAGEADLFFGASLFLREMTLRGFDMLVANGEENVPSFGTAIAVAQDRQDLREALNSILAGMKEDGTLDFLHRKWVLDGTDI